MMKNRLNWEIIEAPISIGEKVEPSQKALVRSDNQKLLGIRSKHYFPIFNRDLDSIKEKIVGTKHFLFKGFEEFNHGKRILLFFKNRRNDFTMCGQNVKEYLIVGNSNDASSKLFVGTSNYMYRCQNQFSHRISDFEWKHDRPFDIDKLNVMELINTYDSGRKELYSTMNDLQNVRIERGLMYELAQKLLHSEKRMDQLESYIVPKRDERFDQLIECIETEINELGPTLWGLFNGVTRYTSNHIKGKPGFGVVNGIGEKMNREALDIIQNRLIK